MSQDEFLSFIEVHLANNLPCVVYRKPNQTLVHVILQKDDQLHITTDFTESGFVFAPFDDSKDAVLMPFDASKVYSYDLGTTDFDSNSNEISESSETDKEIHINLVKKGIETIQKGSMQKVVLSRCETQKTQNGSALQLFLKLLSGYSNAFVYCWFHPKIGLWLGATPETLIQLNGKRFKTMALAGTQSNIGKEEVSWSQKELQEQQYVTDFIVNQLEPHTTSLNITEPKTSKAGHLLHLRTDISGVISTDLKSVVKVLHPTPAVCGLPKTPAKEFILENEAYDRGFYTGFLGELNLEAKISRNKNKRNVENNAYSAIQKTSHLFVNLRCLQLKDFIAIIYIGGGITKDSNPESEWLETVSKSEIMKRVLQA
ncbi:chorismate-binding protein [Psychroserpens sp. XS_ASV72]|uniref:chorismate-binding protein n=1 Tax=Psychroserpens sp. XS_ASV72 TaxID=3241293 RepID=UPI003511BAE2